ncbi:NAD(P)H-dependent oxidoreductase subunit E [Thermodesulfobacteriota bacterium]
MKEQNIDIDIILERYPGEPRYLISLLQDVQASYNYISEEYLRLICDYVGVPVTQAWSVATFYKAFSLEPRGEHEVCVCMGTACHLKGAERITQGIERELNVKRGHTTEDMKVTLDTVNCLGACSMAPVVKIDDKYLGGANQNTVKKYLKKL